MHAIATPLPEYKEPAPRRRAATRKSAPVENANGATAPAVTTDPEKAALLKQLGLDAPMQIVSEAELNAEEFYEAQSDGAELALSRAQRRLLARRKEREEAGERFITKVTYDGEDWFIKRLAAPEVYAVGMRTGRDALGVLDLTNEDVLGGFTASFMFAAAVCGEDDPTPYYESVEDAQAWVDEAGEAGLIFFLFNRITEINTELLAKLETELKKMVKPKPSA